MPLVFKGVMQSTVTPLKDDYNPSQEALYDFYVRLGTSVDLPMIAYNSPRMLSGAEFTGELTRRLIERLPNLIAMKDASFHSEKFLEIARGDYRRAVRSRRARRRGGRPRAE